MLSPNDAISGYSPDGKFFALINKQGILKIWDTETNELKQEYTPNLHLENPCTCFTWLLVNQNTSLKKAKKIRKSTGNTSLVETDQSLYIAFGTSKGGISLYSYSKGEVERNLKGEGHNGKVTSLVFDKQDILYTAGEDCHIICWSLSNEKRIASWVIDNEKPNSLAYLPQSQNLVIGGRQLKIFSLEKKEIIGTYVGHTSDIILLKTFVCGSTEYCLSAARSERIISLWTIKSKMKNRTPTASFLMEDKAYYLSYKFDEIDKVLKIAVVTRSGVVHIYSIAIDSLKADKPINPSTTILIASESQKITEPIMAITASLEYGTKNNELLFGYEDKHFLMFEKIAPNFLEKIQVLIRSSKKLSKSNKQLNESISKTVVPIIKPDSVEYQSSVSNRRTKNDIQIPLENRLQNLHLTHGEIPTAHSKVQLLIQSLHSKDANLLYNVLSTDDMKVINLTLQKLPVQYVSSLVNELTLLMETKHVNVKIATNWLKALLKTHSSQLMALGCNDLLSKFGPCLGIIEHRSNCLKDLSKLNGRLQLLVSQIKRNVEEDALTNENCLVYQDESDTNSDLEANAINESEKGASNNEWEEDNNEDEEDEEMNKTNKDNTGNNNSNSDEDMDSS